MKPRNGLADQVRRSARRLAGEGRIARNVMAAPISAFDLAPGDFPIGRLEAEGNPRTVEQVLEVARRRVPGATYKRATARWYVFSGGGER